MISFRGHREGVYLLRICIIIQCLSIGWGTQKVQREVKKLFGEHEFPNEEHQRYRDEYLKPNHRRSSNSTFLPAGIYNFRTGRLPFLNSDFNDSLTNPFLVTDSPKRRIAGKDQKIRPRKHSRGGSKKKGKTRKSEGKFGDRINVAEITAGTLMKEGNEKIEIYGEAAQEIATGVGANSADNASAENKHKSNGENKKHSEGSGEEHHEDHHDKKHTKGEKEHKGEHHYHKGEKGHHDKEGHKGQYKDKKGTKKGHKEGGGHFEAGVHGEKGQKEAKHSDKEEYKKGHSTRGGHVVHKKDEYEKKHEFYDEHHEGSEDGKHGEYFEEHHAKKGGHKKGGHKHGDASGHHKGKKGHYGKGNKFHEQKAHKKNGRHDKKHEHSEKYGKKGAESNWKKFEYDKGKGKSGDSGGLHSHHQAAVLPAAAHQPSTKISSNGREDGSGENAELKQQRQKYGKFGDEDTVDLQRPREVSAGPAAAAANRSVPTSKPKPSPLSATRIVMNRFNFAPAEML